VRRRKEFNPVDPVKQLGGSERLFWNFFPENFFHDDDDNNDNDNDNTVS